jgi:hypothetical protein
MAKDKQETGKTKRRIDPKTLFGYGLKVAQDLLGMTETEEVKKATLNDIKMDDAQRGKIRLEHKQNMLLNEIRDVEKQKRALFTEGVQKAGAMEQKILASKIVQLDKRMKNLNHTMEAIFVQLRVIDSFIMLKEQESLNKEMGLGSVFGDIELDDLVVLMQQAMEDGDLNMTMLKNLADKLDHASEVRLGYSDNEDVLDVIKQMQMAREAGDGMIEPYYQEMNTGLEKAQEDDSLDSLEFEEL